VEIPHWSEPKTGKGTHHRHWDTERMDAAPNATGDRQEGGHSTNELTKTITVLPAPSLKVNDEARMMLFYQQHPDGVTDQRCDPDRRGVLRKHNSRQPETRHTFRPIARRRFFLAFLTCSAYNTAMWQHMVCSPPIYRPGFGCHASKFECVRVLAVRWP